MKDWFKEAENIEEELIGLRRTLHADPELGNQEFHTTALLEEILQKEGLEISHPLETGLTALLKGGKPGATVALRSDIDALPIQENTGLSYASCNPGKMHACGHDLHMAALVGCAKLLNSHKEELEGNVLFILQPDEEGYGGAQRLVEKGVLNDVSAVFGAHVDPQLKAGEVGIRYGSFYAASIMFSVTVHGKSCHGAEPEKGIDALNAAARMCVELKKLTNPDRVVSVGTLQAGTAMNIIASKASFKGISRVMDANEREKTAEMINQIIHDVEEETGVAADVELIFSYPGVKNHTAETKLAEQCAEELYGKDHTVVFESGRMTTEDFGYYLMERPGTFYHIGCDSEAPLHSEYFLPDEKAIVYGAAMHAAVLSEYLSKHKGDAK